MTTTLSPSSNTQTRGAELDARPPRRWVAPVGTGLLILLIAGAVFTATPVPATRVTPPPDGLLPPPVSPIPVPHSPSAAPGAAGPLVAMADLLEAAPSDSSAGRFAFVEVEHWSRRDQSEIVAFYEQRWRADDGSGRVIVQQLSAQPARGFDLSRIRTTDFSTAPTRTLDYQPGELAATVNGPVATTPQGLAAQLQPGYDDPAPPEVLIDAFIGLHQWNYLGRDSRAAGLRLLAVVDGLVYEGPTTDRLGRPGIAVSLTVAGTRQLLILERHTGELLAAERAVPGFVLDDYTLFLRTERRSTLISHEEKDASLDQLPPSLNNAVAPAFQFVRATAAAEWGRPR